MTRRGSYNVNSGIDLADVNGGVFMDPNASQQSPPPKPKSENSRKCAKIFLLILFILFLIGVVLLFIFAPWNHNSQQRAEALDGPVGPAISARPTMAIRWATTEGNWGRKASIAVSKSTTPSISTSASKPTQTVTTTEVETSPVPVTTPRPKCITPICQELANWSLSLIDRSVSPCSDFYSFACGPRAKSRESLLELHIRLREIITDQLENMNSNSPKSHQTFKAYHDICLEYTPPEANSPEAKAVQEELISKLDRFGSFKTAEEYLESPVDLTKIVAQAILIHSTPLFDILLDVNEGATNYFTYKMTFPHFPPILPNEDNRCYPKMDESNDIKMHDVVDGYIACKRDIQIVLKQVTEAMHYFKIFYSLTEYNRTQMYQDISSTLELSLLPVIYEDRPPEHVVRRKILSKDFKVMSISEMYESFSAINWHELFKTLTSKTPDDTEVVHVYFESYFVKLFQELRDIEPWRLNNALMALYLREQYINFIIAPPLYDMEDYCYDVSVGLMPEIASSIYLSQPKEDGEWARDIEYVLQHVYMINETFKIFVNSSGFPKEYLNSFAEKLKYMRPAVGGDFRQAEDEEKLYSGVEALDLSNGFFTATQYLLERFRDRLYKVKSLHTWSTSATWSHFSSPITANAVNLYSNNMIIIPFALMTKPLSFAEYPPYIEMSGMGTILAHEIAHNFDSVGRFYSPKGFKMKNSTLFSKGQKMETLQECLVSSCGKAHEETLGGASIISYELMLDNKKDEILADFLGLFVTYEAAKKFDYFDPHLELPRLNMTVEQIFFMRFAQMHCTKNSLARDIFDTTNSEYLPSHLRVNSILKQMQAFGDAFACKPGDFMQPVQKCYP